MKLKQLKSVSAVALSVFMTATMAYTPTLTAFAGDGDPEPSNTAAEVVVTPLATISGGNAAATVATDSYKISDPTEAASGANYKYDITLSAADLTIAKDANNKYGYWVGVGIKTPAEGTTNAYSLGVYDQETDYTTGIGNTNTAAVTKTMSGEYDYLHWTSSFTEPSILVVASTTTDNTDPDNPSTTTIYTSYKITYEADDGNAQTENDSFIKNYSISYKQSDGTTNSTADTTDATTSWIADAADNMETIKNEVITLPTIAKNGYTFNGWDLFVGESTTALNGSNVLTGTSYTYEVADADDLADLTFAENWTENTYTLVLDPNGGTFTDDTDNPVYTAGESESENEGKYLKTDTTTNLTALTLPTSSAMSKDNCTFEGWYVSGDANETIITSVTAAQLAATETDSNKLNLIAKWSNDQQSDPVADDPVITITGVKGAEGVDSEIWTVNEDSATFTANEGSATLPTLTKTGYTFNGWYLSTDEDKTILQSNSLTEIDADATYVASWTENTFTITFAKGNDNAESTMQNQVISYTDTLEGGEYADGVTLTANAFTLENYAFAGWQDNAETPNTYDDEQDITTTVTDALASTASTTLNLTAQWEKTFTVVYDFSNDVEAGKTVTLGSGLELTDGKYTATVSNLDGLSNSVYTILGATAVASEQDYSVSAWSVTDDDTSNDATISSGTIDFSGLEAGTTVTLTATWAATFNISYDYGIVASDDVVSYSYATGESNPATFTTGQEIDLAEPQAVGYTFDAWYDNANLEGTPITALSNTTIDQATTLYAKWTRNTYTFSYAVGAHSADDSKENTEFTITSSDFALVAPAAAAGYEFDGWTGGSAIVYDGNNVDVDATIAALDAAGTTTVALTATWDTIPYTFTYNVGAHSADTSKADTEFTIETSDFAITAPAAATGYKFAGWTGGDEIVYDNTNGNVDVDATIAALIAAGETTITLTATWDAIDYTVSLSALEGSITDLNWIWDGTNSVYKRTVNIETPEFTLPTLADTDSNAFVGWKVTGAEDSTASKTVTLSSVSSDKSYVPVWASIHAISYDYGAVDSSTITNTNPITFVEGSADVTLVAPTTTDDALSFVGWFSDQNLTTKITKLSGITAATTVYAKWIDTNSVVVAPLTGWSGTDYTGGNATSYAVSGLTTGTKTDYAINLTAEGLKFHPNGNAKYGYWFGIGFKKAADATVQWALADDDGTDYTDTTVLSGLTYSNQISEFSIGNDNYSTYYIGEDGGQHTDKFVAVMKTTTSSGTTYASVLVNYNVTTEAAYTIAWQDEDGETVTPSGVDAEYYPAYGKNDGNTNFVSITMPAAVSSKTGYDFDGWTDGTTTYAVGDAYTINDVEDLGDLTFKEVWSIHNYSISYNLAGGALAGDVTNPATYNVETETFTLSNPTKENYVFVGWSDGDTTSDEVTIDKGTTGNKSYTAVWVAQYHVAYNLNGGSIEGLTGTTVDITADDLETEGHYTLATATKTGSTFGGWTAGSDANPDSTVTYADFSGQDAGTTLTFTANWTTNTATITINLNGGAFTTEGLATLGAAYVASTVTVPYSADFEGLTIPIPELAGNIFAGWTVGTETDKVVSYTLAPFTETVNVTLTANWTAVVAGDVETVANSSVAATTVTAIADDATDATALTNDGQAAVIDVAVEETTAAEVAAEAPTFTLKVASEIADNYDATTAAADVAVAYVDIDITKYLVNATSGAVEGETAVTELGSAVDFAYTPTDATLLAQIANLDSIVRSHDTGTGIEETTFTKLAAQPVAPYADGTFWVDTVNGCIHIYSSKFSTFAFIYTTSTSYKVTFDANGGTVDTDQILTTGTITFPTSTRSGYTLDGWKASGSATVYSAGATYTPTADITFVAQWTSTGGGGGAGTGGSGGGGSSTVAVTGVTLDQTTASIEVGKTVTLTAAIAPATATNKDVTWKSSDEKVATVKDGVVTGIAAGTATITVTTVDGSKTATATITVTEASEPGTDEPGTDDPGTVDPGTDDPGTDDPSEVTTKATNTITVKAESFTVKVKTNKKGTKTAKKATIAAKKVLKGVKNAVGKVTFTKYKGNAKITISKAGKITIKKGIKTSAKGKTYTLKVKVKAAGNSEYKTKTKIMTIKIKVKAK